MAVTGLLCKATRAALSESNPRQFGALEQRANGYQARGGARAGVGPADVAAVRMGLE